MPMPEKLSTLLRHDLPASLVVFLVAVPLSLGIAAASDAPILAGLIAAAVGGIVAGLLGGAPLQVSGPAAGLTVIVAELVAQFGWATTCAITVIAGLVQILLGLSRVARTAMALSPAVVHGMLAGIGLTIALGQLHVVLGADSPGNGWDNLIELPGQLLTPHGPATSVGLIAIGVMVGWRWMPAAVRRVPAPLAAVGCATLLSMALALPVDRVDLPGDLFRGHVLPAFPDGEWAAFAVGVLTVALVASVESLLSAMAVDGMHRGPRASLNRELVGQGVANTLSGGLGGLPVTGVIVRSTANVTAGARTRASAVLHGVWVVVITLFLTAAIEEVPLAALAGLLVVIGVRLVDLRHVRAVRRHGDLSVYVVTAGGVVFLNLLEGVLAGLALAIALTLRRVLWAGIHASESGGRHRVIVEGTLSFLAVPRLSRVLGSIPEGSDVVVELVVDFLDHAAYDHLSLWIDRHRAGGGTVVVEEVGQPALEGDPGARSRTGPAVTLPRWFSPWAEWQAGEPGDRVLIGAREYQRRARPLVQPFLAELSDHQAPTALFITCADARVVPNLITTSGPGDLFTVRNVGNLVPPYSAGGEPSDPDVSVAAAVEYAVDVLHVPTIVVCGHSGCGAMNALRSGGDRGRGALASWLRTARASRQRCERDERAGTLDPQFDPLDRLVQANVRQQLDHLATHPSVARALGEGRVRLIGMFFDIGAAEVYVDSKGQFAPVEEAAVLGTPA
ncbi:bifunctional SulP family inorganic anion transporter/carbonic anhydrase [Cryptosporangium japonicum]|uniref:carbonic anhydrase n=1 Tax=Cryptosporangium japonicum TaxID=80872 RepID=A0ABP3CZC1_9ACTN